MKILLLFIVVFFLNKSYSQQKIYYINIPSILKQGTIVYDLHSDPKDSVFNITFSGFLKKDEPAGFFIFCYKEFQKVQKVSLDNGEILTPEMTMDSLTRNGRPFFRKHTFYALFVKGESYYIHRVRKGEYIYMSYENE